jgi:two-component system OmpR family sensor kinase
MSLRRRLTLTMAVLLVLGLAATDLLVYSSVRSYLYGRLDEQLDVAQHQGYVYLVHEQHRGRTPNLLGLSSRESPDTYVEVLTSGGKVLLRRPSGSLGAPDPAPVLPVPLPIQRSPSARLFGNHHGVYHPEADAMSVAATGGGGPAYRIQAVAVPQGSLVTAISLVPTEQTLASLLRIELAASAAMVLVLCAAAAVTIRRGLAPLQSMATTADEIAQGDLTRRVEAEDEDTEIRRLGQALNAMLVQIEQAFEAKTASEERLRQFVADASHELRTPLTSIRGYTELLGRGAFTDDAGRRRALRRVEHEAARMGGLVDDLLLLARLDQGRPLDEAPVDLRTLAADALDDAGALAPGRTLELEAPAAVVVTGDADRLGQVAHNLVRNALAHTPEETPVTVRVSVRGPVGVLEVVDHGPGLDPVVAEHAFDRFYRGDEARSGQGTGLGLAIVAAIAEALGGRAWTVPTPGGGATFGVEVPLAPGPSTPAPARRAQLAG